MEPSGSTAGKSALDLPGCKLDLHDAVARCTDDGALTVRSNRYRENRAKTEGTLPGALRRKGYHSR